MLGRLALGTLCFHIAPISGSGLSMSRYDLTDFEWRVIKPLLPNKPRGCRGRVLRSGAPWRDLPGRYGPRTICYNRFGRWRKAGVGSDDGHHNRRPRRRYPNDRQHLHSRAPTGATVKRGIEILSRSLPRRAHDQNSCGRGRARPSGPAGPDRWANHYGQAADHLLDHVGPGTIVLADKAYDADRMRASLRAK